MKATGFPSQEGAYSETKMAEPQSEGHRQYQGYHGGDGRPEDIGQGAKDYRVDLGLDRVRFRP